MKLEGAKSVPDRSTIDSQHSTSPRRVVPELLDGLDADDPSARRSRRDLRIINELMGNFRWIEREIVEAKAHRRRIVEIGAGEGALCRKLSARLPEARVVGIDLAPRPRHLPTNVEWRRGDLFAELPGCRADVLAGVMILHHFSDERLGEFGKLLENFPIICFCEPWRAALPQVWGGLMWPWIGRVTRHDMPVSIKAGFRPGELPALLGLKNWRVREAVDWRGSLRLLAVRIG